MLVSEWFERHPGALVLLPTLQPCWAWLNQKEKKNPKDILHGWKRTLPEIIRLLNGNPKLLARAAPVAPQTFKATAIGCMPELDSKPLLLKIPHEHASTVGHEG